MRDNLHTNFGQIGFVDLEIYKTDPPEICVGVVPYALVCAKNLVQWNLFPRPQIEKSGEISSIFDENRLVRGARWCGGGLVWEIFRFCTREISRSTKPIRPKFVWELPRML